MALNSIWKYSQSFATVQQMGSSAVVCSDQSDTVRVSCTPLNRAAQTYSFNTAFSLMQATTHTPPANVLVGVRKVEPCEILLSSPDTLLP